MKMHPRAGSAIRSSSITKANYSFAAGIFIAWCFWDKSYKPWILSFPNVKIRSNISSSCIPPRILHQEKLWFLQPMLHLTYQEGIRISHKYESHLNYWFGPGCFLSSVKAQATTNTGLSVQLFQTDASYSNQHLEFQWLFSNSNSWKTRATE